MVRLNQILRGYTMSEPVMTIVTKAYEDIRTAAESEHTGFCMSTYKKALCFDCFSEAECLGMFVADQKEAKNGA